MDAKSLRDEIMMNLDWKFNQSDVREAWQKDYLDENWQPVTLPHDWSVHHGFDIRHSSGTGYLPGGTAWYRKTFSVPECYLGRRAMLTFDGVYKNSQVWFNGYYLGRRPYGYTTFSYDVTPFLETGDINNVVAVRVQHEDVADSRWFTGSGIYRKVTLTLSSLVGIDHQGIFIRTEEVTDGKAKVVIATTLRNQTNKGEIIHVRQRLFGPDLHRAPGTSIPRTDGQGAPVDAKTTDQEVSINADQAVSIDADQAVQTEQVLTVENPKLWSLDEPALYQCLTEVYRDNVLIDQTTTPFGIRTFRFDPNDGFFLNDQSMKIKGVCVHHDAGCLGAAVRPAVWERRLQVLKQMGCNAVRMSHNPHMQELYDLCDRMGFLVMDEAFDEWEGVKNKWTRGHNVYPPAHYGYYEDFPTWHEQDLTAMILRDRNHPSIILWSIGNEVDYPNDPYNHHSFAKMEGNNDANKPAAEKVYNPNKPNAEHLVRIAARLVKIVKKVDSSRPVTAALAYPELSSLTGYADCLDVAGYNYKEHLYDKDHVDYPDRIILGSENGKRLEHWKAVQDRAFISGLFLWTGIDFLGETRGWPSHGSEAGLIDLAGFEKPAYYLWQKFWSDRLMVRVFAAYETLFEHPGAMVDNKNLSRDWSFGADEMIRVVCLSNGCRTELLLNDQSLGIQMPEQEQEGCLVWRIPFSKGVLRARTYDCQSQVATDEIVSAGPAVRINMLADRSELPADGQSMAQITLSIVDERGTIVAKAQDLVRISIEGPGVLMGLENGILSDTTPYSADYRRVGRGRLLIYVSSTTLVGTIRVRAQVQGMKTEVLELVSFEKNND